MSKWTCIDLMGQCDITLTLYFVIFKVCKHLRTKCWKRLIFHWKQLTISTEAKMKHRIRYPGASIINWGRFFLFFFIPVMLYQIHGSDDNITLTGIISAGVLVTRDICRIWWPRPPSPGRLLLDTLWTGLTDYQTLVLLSVPISRVGCSTTVAYTCSYISYASSAFIPPFDSRDIKIAVI